MGAVVVGVLSWWVCGGCLKCFVGDVMGNDK